MVTMTFLSTSTATRSDASARAGPQGRPGLARLARPAHPARTQSPRQLLSSVGLRGRGWTSASDTVPSEPDSGHRARPRRFTHTQHGVGAGWARGGRGARQPRSGQGRACRSEEKSEQRGRGAAGKGGGQAVAAGLCAREALPGPRDLVSTLQGVGGRGGCRRHTCSIVGESGQPA